MDQRGDEIAHADQQVFAVVEHEQLRAGTEERGTGREHVPVDDVHFERRGERLGDCARIRDRGKGHDGGLVSSGGDLRRQGGLAHAARAEHGDQSTRW